MTWFCTSILSSCLKVSSFFRNTLEFFQIRLLAFVQVSEVSRWILVRIDSRKWSSHGQLVYIRSYTNSESFWSKDRAKGESGWYIKNIGSEPIKSEVFYFGIVKVTCAEYWVGG